MQEVERGFSIVSAGMRKGKFTRREMEFIIQVCEALIRDTRKVLDSGPAKISADSGAGANNTQQAQPKMPLDTMDGNL
jgi:hypothetical protein